MFWLIASLVLGIAGAVAISCLYLDDIISWFKRNKNSWSKEEIGILIKEKMESGNYTVKAGIFNKNTDSVTCTNSWESNELNSDLNDLFDNENEIVIEI